MASIFTKIISGEIPCYKIFEDEHTFAFLDINPVNLGHTLIVPKIEVDNFVDVPEPYYCAVFVNAKKIAKAIQQATGCERVGTTILGWDVPHFHYHIIPMRSGQLIEFSQAKQRSEDDMKEIQEKIIGFIAK